MCGKKVNFIRLSIVKMWYFAIEEEIGIRPRKLI